MQILDLKELIQEVISKFSENRSSPKPVIFVTFPQAVTRLPWPDKSLRDFVRFFLYQALTSNHREASLEVLVHRSSELNDLARIVGIRTDYWVQLRVMGRGLRMEEKLVEELFADIGYRCEEWVAVRDTRIRLGVFSDISRPRTKMVFCLESSYSIHKCDLLLPVVEPLLLPHWIADEQNGDLPDT
jgi:hypothetical protein